MSRQLPIMTGPPGPETSIDGITYLYFAGTNYLGLAAHPEVIEAGCRALRDFGVHSATSRSGFGTNGPVQAVERRAAAFFGTEEAYYLSSGYFAPQITIRALAREADIVLLDDAAHYSSQDAGRLAGIPALSFRTRDPSDLARSVEGHRRVLVLADAVGPATGELAPVLEYIAVLERLERATLLLDDAHGIGLLGDQGRGLLDHLRLWPRANGHNSAGGVGLAVCGTLAKAIGGFGGVIPGTGDFVGAARRGSHHFEGASAPPCGAAGATAMALEVAAREPRRRDQVRENASRLRRGLRKLGLAAPDGPTAHLGLNMGDAANMRRIHASLKARQILVPYFESYSGLPPEGVLRFAVFADHTADQIDHLLSELREIL
jgi:8-amino-7-oxononanoate synthase